MKTLCLFISLFSLVPNLFAQKDYDITEADLIITLPNNRWAHKKERLKTSTVYHFKREHHHAKDSTIKKLEIVAVVEPIKSGQDVELYSLMKKKQYLNLKKYKVEQVFTKNDGLLQIDDAIGYRATYEENNGAQHTFYFIHIVKGDKGIQVILNTPSVLYKNHEEELLIVIRSLRYKE